MHQEHYDGHRQRIRKRFMEQGLQGFQDYEALELLLTFVTRQQDMKPVAKALVDRFGSFKNVLDAPAADLEAIEGVGPACAALILLVKQSVARYINQTTRERLSPEDPQALIQSCMASMGALDNESFRVICLDSNFTIVAEKDISEAAFPCPSRSSSGSTRHAPRVSDTGRGWLAM